METEDMMDWMLEEAKKSPMKISHDFDTRFRVWVIQIISARVNAIRQCNGDADYAMRMMRLTSADAKRLIFQAAKEGGTKDKYSLRYDRVLYMLVEANDAYLNEVKQ